MLREGPVILLYWAGTPSQGQVLTNSSQIDVDENLETANAYSIACVPTVRVYCNEKKLHENFGWNSDRLTRAINVSN